MQGFDLIDEQQIRDAGELPHVSRRLRRHVLRVAKKAERRRRIRRRVVLAASILLPLVVLTGWIRGTDENLKPDLAAEGSAVELPSVSEPLDTVDESLRKRKLQSETIRGALY